MSAVRRRRPGPQASLSPDAFDRLVADAQRGYDVDALIARRGRRGRPALGSAPATVESVRLDPELKELLVKRAADDGVPVSEVIRTALREHLAAG